MLIVPVGGFEVNVKQVPLQPASQTANSSAARNAAWAQCLLRRFKLKSTACNALRVPEAPLK